jgi:uncharacterized protein (DUF58 family)
VSTRCRVRGEFLLGPTTLVAGDPFGLFSFRKQASEAIALTVYPRVEPLPGLALPHGEVTRESAIARRSEHSTPRISGLREYAPGDAYNRIHWPTSARLGQLMVKEFEQDPSADVWIVVDADPDVHVGEGEDSTLDLSITIAASIAAHYLARNLSVALLSAGDAPFVLHPDRGHRQHLRMLEWLARLDANSALSIAELLVAEARWFNRNSTIFLITPSTEEEWTVMLREIADHGSRCNAVVIDASSFGAPESPMVVVGNLALARIPAAVVRAGDAIGATVAFHNRAGSAL